MWTAFSFAEMRIGFGCDNQAKVEVFKVGCVLAIFLFRRFRDHDSTAELPVIVRVRAEYFT